MAANPCDDIVCREPIDLDETRELYITAYTVDKFTALRIQCEIENRVAEREEHADE